MSKQVKKRRKQEAVIEASKKNSADFDHIQVKNPTDSLFGKILIAVIALGMVGGSIVAIIFAMANSPL